MLYSRFRSSVWIVVLLAVTLVPLRAFAIGWGPTDFLITGAPNFPDRIGVFDSNFGFKGYLDQSFLGVQGMDFDANGNLVAQSSSTTNAEIRIYSPAGNRIGGFTANNSMLQYTGDLKVAPNGNYAFGTYTSGVEVYSPQGAFVTQYGSGDSRGITYLPGNRLWSGGAGSTVHIFDTTSGAQVGSFDATGQTMSYSMQYSGTTNSVLIVDELGGAGGIFERDIAGNTLHQFYAPSTQANFYSATRGPDGDVIGTTGKSQIGSNYYDLVDWNSSGVLKGKILSYPVNTGAVRILWVGNSPEPSALSLTGLAIALLKRHRRNMPPG